MARIGALQGDVILAGGRLRARDAAIAVISVALAACGAALLVRARTGGVERASKPASVRPAAPAAQQAAQAPNAIAETEALQRHLRASPDDIDARVKLAVLLDSRTLASDAEDVLRAALQRGQKHPAIFHALGMVYLHNDRFDGAIEAFRAELLFRPKDAAAHLGLAQSYAYALLTDDARREFECSRALDPSNPEVYLGLAFVNNGSERYPLAVKYLQEYVRRSTNPGPAYGLLSRVYLNMRKYDDAVKAGQAAAAAMPDNGSVWYNLGQAYSYRPGTESLGQAVEAFQHAVRLLPNWGHAHFELGYAYARQDKAAEAIAQYREAARCEPTHGKYIYELGRMLIRNGQPEEGKKEIARAEPLIALNQRETQLTDKLAVSPRDPKVYLELERIYQRLGDSVQAAKCREASKVLSCGRTGIKAAFRRPVSMSSGGEALAEPDG